MGVIDPASDLLRALSWHTEKLLRKRGKIFGVIWLTETRTGHREMFETQVDGDAPVDASNVALLAKLIAEMREDFTSTGVAAFACAYSAKRVTSLRTTRVGFATDIVVIEAHDIEGVHICVERELVTSPSGQVSLLAAAAPEPAAASIYASILEPAVRLQAAS